MSKAYIVKKGIAYLKHYGPSKLFRKALGKLVERDDYSKNWQSCQPDDEILFEQRSEWFSYMPKISILVPVFDPPKQYFGEMLVSVLEQTYFNWQLCIVDAGKEKLEDFINQLTAGDERIKYLAADNEGIAGNTNKALEMATGDYIALLDNDDILSPQALFLMVKKINEEKSDCVYSDEDKVNSDLTKHFCPHKKPDFNMGLLRTNNYICHLFMVKRELANMVGGFSSEYDGAQDFDFILKCVENSKVVSHVPEILYHWRTHEQSTSSNPLSKLYAYEAGKKAIEAHLARNNMKGRVYMLEDMGFYKIRYELKGLPKVKVVILGTGKSEEPGEYVKYIRTNTDYDNMSICAMKEPNAERLKEIDCDYFMVIRVGMEFRENKWLRNLCARMEQEQLDAIAARILIKHSVAYGGSLVMAGKENNQENVGKPGWYKGVFNHLILQSDARVIPSTGILIKKDTYINLLEAGMGANFESTMGQRFAYEPNVTIRM